MYQKAADFGTAGTIKAAMKDKRQYDAADRQQISVERQPLDSPKAADRWQRSVEGQPIVSPKATQGS